MTKATSRREFLRYAAQLGSLGAAAPLGLNLAAINAAAAQTSTRDDFNQYRAIVCIFLYGGNDAYNSVVPYDSESYSRYKAAREGVLVPYEDLASTIIRPSGGWPDGRSVALHPKLAPLHQLYEEKKLTLAMNVGTLNQPTSMRQFIRKENLPPKLMSHNDQFSLWQTLATEGASSGWGGRLGDLLAAHNHPNKLLTNISIASSSTFSSGEENAEFMMGQNGVVKISPNAILPNSPRMIDQILNHRGTHSINNEFSVRYQQNKEGTSIVGNAISGVPSPDLGASPIAKQLATVAQLVSVQQALGTQRQVFFVSMEGFDSHGNLGTRHPFLLEQLGEAMLSFQRYLEGLNMDQQVTTFTASDFGRSLTTNGRGSDHGWGGHQFVMGGAVKGASYVGALPSVELDSNDDVGQGRLLPAIAVDQLASTLALWMGVSESELPIIIPNIGSYNTKDLGFLSS